MSTGECPDCGMMTPEIDVACRRLPGDEAGTASPKIKTNMTGVGASEGTY